jgi:hypothetical protein
MTHQTTDNKSLDELKQDILMSHTQAIYESDYKYSALHLTLDEAFAAAEKKAKQAIEAMLIDARIDELEHWTENEPPYGKWIEYLNARIAQLKQSKETSDG